MIKKGTLIREVKTNPDPIFENTTANRTLVWMVTRVNPKTYSVKCVEGYWKGHGCNIHKNFKPEYTDVYGTTTRYEVIA